MHVREPEIELGGLVQQVAEARGIDDFRVGILRRDFQIAINDGCDYLIGWFTDFQEVLEANGVTRFKRGGRRQDLKRDWSSRGFRRWLLRSSPW